METLSFANAPPASRPTLIRRQLDAVRPPSCLRRAGRGACAEHHRYGDGHAVLAVSGPAVRTWATGGNPAVAPNPACIAAGAVEEQLFENPERGSVAMCSDPFGNGFCLIEEKA